MRRWTIVATVCLLASSATGCATKYLVFSTYTKVGLDVAAADGQPTHAMFGYKRFEGAVVPVDVCTTPASDAPMGFSSVTSSSTPSAENPREVPVGSSSTENRAPSCTKDGEEEAEAMSVYAGLEITNSWLRGVHILQLFATGSAAVNGAENPEAFADLVRKVRKDEKGESK